MRPRTFSDFVDKNLNGLDCISCCDRENVTTSAILKILKCSFNICVKQDHSPTVCAVFILLSCTLIMLYRFVVVKMGLVLKRVISHRKL